MTIQSGWPAPLGPSRAKTVPAWDVEVELAEDPGAEDQSQAGLGQVDLSVRVAAKIRLHLPLQGRDLLVEDGDHRDQGPGRWRRRGR